MMDSLNDQYLANISYFKHNNMLFLHSSHGYAIL